MVSGGSVDGLVSGLSTSQLISQLMQVEAAPQTALRSKVSVAQKVVSAYQNINIKFAALLTASDALTKSATWKSVKATSSSDAVVATASDTAQSGSISFTVDKLARAHSIVTALTASSPSATIVSGPASIDYADGRAFAIQPADGSLTSVAAAINAGDSGVKASVVRVGPDLYRLQMTAATAGTNSEFTVSGLEGLGGFQTTATGSDAQLTVGAGSPAQYTIVSPTNTFTDVIPGVTFTATKTTTSDVTVSAAADPDSVAAKVQAMVDAANGTLAEIDKYTTYKSGDTAAGPLAGDFAARSLSQQVIDGVSNASVALGSLKKVGIEITRDGRLTFDKAAFTAAYNANPAGTEKFFDDAANGVAQKLKTTATVVTKGTGTSKGMLQILIDNHNSAIKDLNDRIGGWDIRLDNRKQALQREFTGLETALSKMKNQSSWLAGQLASL